MSSYNNHYLAKRGKHVMEIFFVNESVSVMINHVEGFLKFLDLVLNNRKD